MKLNNRFGYPETIVKAIENDPYDKGECDFSATGLLEPTRKRVLTLKYKDQLEEDVDDGIWRLFGQLGHLLVERAGTGLNHVVEKRFFGDVDGTKVSAQIDSFSLESDGTLIDWKFTTVYGFKRDVKPKREWIAQMNIQNYLVGLSGLLPKKLQIWGVLRDWRPKEHREDSTYPNKLGFHDIPMHSKDSVERFIKKRVKLHREAEQNLPLCSQDDNWKWNRCNGYCAVSAFCEQYQSHLKQKRETKL